MDDARSQGFVQLSVPEGIYLVTPVMRVTYARLVSDFLDLAEASGVRHVADIAAVAVETLADPDAHAGAVYAPTGPEALTVAEVADIITGVTSRPVIHNDIERKVWIECAIAAGVVPADYGVMLSWLTATIASGRGSRPNDDVRKVTGSPPASFADFAHRNAHAWALPAAHA